MTRLRERLLTGAVLIGAVLGSFALVSCASEEGDGGSPSRLADGGLPPSNDDDDDVMPGEEEPDAPTDNEPESDDDEPVMPGEPDPDDPDPDEPVGDPGEPASSSPETVTRVARLSHSQYTSTVSDLFGIDDPPGAAFAPDALNGFEFDTTIDLAVDARLGPQYRTAAEDLAARAASDADVFARIVPCDDGSCAAQFIASFGERAFRRPLTSDEQSRFETLFGSGAELVASGDAFADGVRVVVEAMLQSPQFLYRAELSGDVDAATGRIPLDGFEVASRLSYFLWNTMPDEELFSAARAGLTSPDEIAQQVARMLADERATDKLVSFHAQAWLFDKLTRIAPDADTYPEAPPNLGAIAGEATRMFVGDVIESGGGLSELLTAPYAFADQGLAGLYGQDVGGGLQRIDFGEDERRGILMQVGFLAAHAHSIKTDPIHRGLFVMRNVLCVGIPDPDASFSQLGLPESDTPPETTRQEVELLTGTNANPDPMRQSTCGTCHTLINPAGFAFEGFDAVGQPRETENGVAVDTAGTLMLDGVAQTFTGALDLVALLAASQAAKDCYAGKLTNFAHGHDAIVDPELAAALAAATSTQEAVTLIATAASFRERVENEVAP